MYKNINRTLIEGRHKVIMNGELPMFHSNGNIIMQDVQENKIFDVPVCEEMLKFFNLQFTEDSPLNSPSVHDNNKSCDARKIEQDKSTVSACWKDDNEMRCLIRLWRDHQSYFKTMKSRNVWALICQELQKTDSQWKKTPIQCENKWKDVKRKYMETKDHNNKSGNDPKTCKFYEDLEEILGEKPCVKPIAVASNLNKKRISSEEVHNFEETTENSGSTAETQDKEASQTKKRKMTKMQRELKDWSANLLADAKMREEAKERRHKEIIAETKTATEAYKEFMAKLIDKL